MGLFDILRGQRTPKRANLDRLFALSTSALTIQTSLGFESSGRAGLCFKELEAGMFDELVRDIDQLLSISGGESGTTVERHTDEAAHLASSTPVNPRVYELYLKGRHLCGIWSPRGPLMLMGPI